MGRHKTHFPGPEFFQPQELQAKHLMIKVDGLLKVLGVHHKMI